MPLKAGETKVVGKRRCENDKIIFPTPSKFFLVQLSQVTAINCNFGATRFMAGAFRSYPFVAGRTV